MLLVKNVGREGPGLVSTILAGKGVPFEVVDLSAGEAFPDPRGYSAVFVFGGPDSANDETPKMREELMRIKQCLQQSIPFFGVCLGMQALVKAGGGWVLPARHREVGWRDGDGRYYEMELSEEGRKDGIFSGLPRHAKVFQLHGETVRLSDGMTLLATGRHCHYQAVKVGEKAYGLQGHLELTPEMHAHWLEHDEWLRRHYRGSLLSDFRSIRNEYELNCRLVVANFLEKAGVQ